MITFDLKCENGHVFEGWFRDNAAYDEQRSACMISCPVCESVNIEKQLSPVARVGRHNETPHDSKELSNEDVAFIIEKIQEHIRNSTEDVGSDFAKEALKIHYNVTEKRNIRGVATEEEEKMLAEEGVPFIKLPLPSSGGKKKTN